MTATMGTRGGDAPDIQSVDDLLRKMREGTSSVHTVTMRSLSVPVRILSQDEHNEIRRAALTMNRSASGDDVDFNVLRQKLTLKKASEVKPGQPGIFSDKFLASQSLDELSYWYKEYMRINDLVNPSIETMTQDQFTSIVDALKKNTISPSDLSMPQLKGICTAFVDLVQRLEEADRRMASSSGGPLPTSP